MSRSEKAACTPVALNPLAFNENARIPYGLKPLDRPSRKIKILRVPLDSDPLDPYCLACSDRGTGPHERIEDGTPAQRQGRVNKSS